jgi:UDPglucose 6-dehydrogenase
VTFKPNTDDMRDAPSLTLVPAMIGGGASVRVIDPQGRHEGEALLPNVEWYDDVYIAAKGADLVVVLTEWNEFRALDLPQIVKAMATPHMADLRNIYDAEIAKEAGFTVYSSVGRPDLMAG